MVNRTPEEAKWRSAKLFFVSGGAKEAERIADAHRHGDDRSYVCFIHNNLETDFFVVSIRPDYSYNKPDKGRILHAEITAAGSIEELSDGWKQLIDGCKFSLRRYSQVVAFGEM